MKRILCLVVIFFIPIVLLAQVKPVNTFQQKVMLLKRFMEKNHYLPLLWTDTSSAILFDKWIDELDEEKLFFTQKDIVLLNNYKTKLDDEMNGKGWEFFTISTNLFRSRVQKVDSVMQLFLSQPIDVTKPDNFIWPASTYAADTKELATRWQRYLKWRLLYRVVNKMETKEKPVTASLPADFAKVELEERQRIKKKETSYVKTLLSTPTAFEADMRDEYLNAIAWCYDPHSNYFNTKEKNEFEADVSAMEFSAGISVNENEKGDKAIEYLQPGGSAWRSGQIHKGDVLVSIKNKEAETEVADISIEEVNSLLKGGNSDDIEVTVKTEAGELKTVKLVQEKINSEDGIVKSYVLKTNKTIGYINLPGFYSKEEEGEAEMKFDGCANDVSKEIIKLRKNNIEGLILDLRGNGGGSMWEAMQLAGIFIDIGPVASVKDKYGKVNFLKDPNRGTIYDGPLIVLTNGQSASASEFLSATLQDYSRALIVGGTTYGKGSAQIVLPMDTNKIDANMKYEDFVKVTMEKFYRVNGSTVQWKGVEPDIALPDLYEDISFKEKGNASALKQDLSKVGNYRPDAALPIASLKNKSENRIKDEPYFKGKMALAKWISSYKNGISIPLQWAAYTQFYKKTKDEFAILEKYNNDTINVIKAENNSFDKEKFALASKQVKDTNNTYLKNIASDKVLAEACKIFADWIIK